MKKRGWGRLLLLTCNNNLHLVFISSHFFIATLYLYHQYLLLILCIRLWALGKRLPGFSRTTPTTLPTSSLGVVRLIPLVGWELSAQSTQKKIFKYLRPPGSRCANSSQETRESVGNPPPTRVAGVAQHPQPADSQEKKKPQPTTTSLRTHTAPPLNTTPPHHPTTHHTHTPKPQKCPQKPLLLPLKLL